MAIVTLPNIGGGSDPATINVSVLNGKVDPLATDYNGNIQNVNIASGAGIVYSKLSLTDGILNADINSSAAIASSKLDLSAVAQTVVMSSKAINQAKGSDIASATTTDIGAMVGNYGDVTGTTTITGLGTVQAGTQRVVRFTGALTLTHNGTSLLLPTAANITTAANDVAGFVSLGSGNWKCLWYQRYSGVALIGATAATSLTGSVIQTLNDSDATAGTNTATTTWDDDPFTTSEGAEILSKAITPNSTSNFLHITGQVQGACQGTKQFIVGLFSDQADYGTATNAIWVGAQYLASDAATVTVPIDFYVQVATLSATTFSVRYSTDGSAAYVNRTQANASGILGGKMISSFTIKEIKG